MADLSKIKLNGTEYELKDAVARSDLLLLQAALDNKEDKEKQFIITYTLSSSTVEQYDNSNHEYYLLSGVRDKTVTEILSAIADGYVLYAQIIDELYDVSYSLIKGYYTSSTIIDIDYPIIFEDAIQHIEIFDTNNLSGSQGAGRGKGFIDFNYQDENSIQPETDTNVKTMLANFGLDTTTQLEQGTAGTSKAGSSVVTE